MTSRALVPSVKLMNACVVLALVAGACASRRTERSPTVSPRCTVEPGAHVSWDRPATTRGELDAWCAAVGPPVVVSSPAPRKQIARLVVLSWNVHVGGGDLAALATLLKKERAQLDGETGLVLLLQEAFRAGAQVGDAPRGAPVPDAIRPKRPSDDIVQVAAQLGMSAFYVPSMRNGRSRDIDEQEDRGSAIVSTEPLSDLTAIELPMARQRRVAVMATVTPRNSVAAPLRLVSTHFDIVVFGGGAVRQAQHLAQRITTLNAPRLPLIIGADANPIRGFDHGTVTALDGIAPVLRRCGTGRTSAWLARSDFIFSDVPQPFVSSCETLDDRYGSDHRPIVMTIDYRSN